MKKHILISGKPRSGKTTLIKKIFYFFKDIIHIDGFWTTEELYLGRRVGFNIRTTNGKRGILARIQKSNFKIIGKIGKYFVTNTDLDNIAVPLLYTDSKIKIIDEIGKMELLSPNFKEAILYTFKNCPLIIATIGIQNDSFSNMIKARKNVSIFNLTGENRDELFELLLSKVSYFMKEDID